MSNASKIRKRMGSRPIRGDRKRPTRRAKQAQHAELKFLTAPLAKFIWTWRMVGYSPNSDELDSPARKDLVKAKKMTQANGLADPLNGRTMYRGVRLSTGAPIRTMERMLLGGKLRLDAAFVESWSLDPSIAAEYASMHNPVMGMAENSMGVLLSQRLEKNDVYLNLADDAVTRNMIEWWHRMHKGPRFRMPSNESEVVVSQQCRVCDIEDVHAIALHPQGDAEEYGKKVEKMLIKHGWKTSRQMRGRAYDDIVVEMRSKKAVIRLGW